ncbi:hypothetical protein NECAME_15592 [Necator americanus]|uniref:Uncharacterized protein n=1 Tax=Necator americanus TaxID=51031 RepID=W2SJF3_NECAM|nr:hypothetical protein NECAME_15592 [Necator americanus]ETN68872.1 hypothetical protein NECAME_15592 [Necator americanus]
MNCRLLRRFMRCKTKLLYNEGFPQIYRATCYFPKGLRPKPPCPCPDPPCPCPKPPCPCPKLPCPCPKLPCPCPEPPRGDGRRNLQEKIRLTKEKNTKQCKEYVSEVHVDREWLATIAFLSV